MTLTKKRLKTSALQSLVSTLYTLTRSCANRQAANTIAQWENEKIYIMEISQSQTECIYITRSFVLLITVQQGGPDYFAQRTKLYAN